MLQLVIAVTVLALAALAYLFMTDGNKFIEVNDDITPPRRKVRSDKGKKRGKYAKRAK